MLFSFQNCVAIVTSSVFHVPESLFIYVKIYSLSFQQVSRRVQRETLVVALLSLIGSLHLFFTSTISM